MVGTGRPATIQNNGIQGMIGPEDMADNQFGEYDFSDHEIGDSRNLTVNEESRRGDPKFDQDLEYFPMTFSTPEDALDTYNELGFRVKIQFRLYEQKRKNGKIIMFSLVCSMRNNPKFLPKYTGGTFTKLSMCNVNVRFVYSSNKNQYVRVEGSWKSIHDHKLDLEDECKLPAKTMDDIKKWYMQNPQIKVSQLIKNVKESSHQVNDNGVSVFLHLRHLEVLNALLEIRGTGMVNHDELMQDLQNVQTKFPDAQVQVASGTPMIIFVQTDEMLTLHRLYKDTIMLNVSKKRKNKYDFYVIQFTGINNFGNSLVFATAFTNIKCKETYNWVIQHFLERAKTQSIPKPQMMILPLDQDLIDSQLECYGSDQKIRIIANQYHFLSHTKDLIQPYKKRMDFDFLLCTEKLEEIVQETNQTKFDKLQREIEILIGVLERQTIADFGKVFQMTEMWSMIKYKNCYTAGLHSNERAATVESFMRIQHKFDSNILEMLEATKRMQMKDMALECNSKEAHSYFTHPVYAQMRSRFSQYALSLMLHQMLVSYKYIAFEDEVIELVESQGDTEMHDTKPSCFTVKTDKPNEEYKL